MRKIMKKHTQKSGLKVMIQIILKYIQEPLPRPTLKFGVVLNTVKTMIKIILVDLQKFGPRPMIKTIV